jgi:hypothetical protein
MEFEHNAESSEFIGENEIDDFFIKTCSLISLLSNKTLSPTSIIITMIQNPEMRQLVCEITDMSYFEFVKKMSYNYDIVNRSKKILYALNKANDRE